MDVFTLIPSDGDCCDFCGRPILQSLDAVLVSDGPLSATWWHMACRDIVIPFLQHRGDGESDIGDDATA